MINGADFGSGLRSRILCAGGSVANASAAKVSIIKLTQSSCTADKTDVCSEDATAETKVRSTAVMLTVSWNYEVVSFRGKKINSKPVMYLQEFLHGIVDSSPPHDGLDDARKIVVH